MRLADLAARTGLPTATIKYYVRAGLLPPGTAESSTWATYDESHVRRLGLVRALTEVAGLSLKDVRRVVESVETAASQHGARGAAQWQLSPEVRRDPSRAALDRVDDLLRRHGWEVSPESPHRRTLADALDRLTELGLATTDRELDLYAAALRPVAEAEVAAVAAEPDPVRSAERLVLGTLLYEPVLVTMRRMAHEAVSSRQAR